RVDERHVRQRRAPGEAPQALAGRRDPDRRDGPPLRAMTRVRFTASSDTGQRRRHNEDSYVCEPPLFAVADGMGGAQAGEIASQLAASSLRKAGHDGPSDEEHVVSLIREANRSVYERARTDEATSGMGTTMTVALVGDDVVRIG